MARFNVIFWALLAGQFVLKTSGTFPETVTVSIQNNNEMILLNWKRAGEFLANENLPLWSVRNNADPVLISNVMENMGSFAMYHDLEKSSAVVYFTQFNSFFGVIDTRFYIDGLPLNEIEHGVHHKVNELYVKRRVQDHTKSFHDDSSNTVVSAIIPGMNVEYVHSFFDLIASAKASTSSTDPTKKNQQDDILYPEILVFITNDIIQQHMTQGHSLQSLVKYYLVHLNAVDMLYAKLAKDDIRIHINIAGLVLEDEPAAFDFITFITPKPNQPDKVLDTDQTLSQFQNYLRGVKHIFVEDSYDFFLLSTGYVLQRKDLELKGIALSELCIYDDRVDGYHDPLGFMVERQSFYADYITTAHELAHTMDAEHDSKSGGHQCDGLQCFAIMQQVGSYCKNCLVWSEKSRKEFEIYLRTNQNRCFLLNSPRSLHPHGTIMVSISPSRQCACYGFRTHLPTPFYLDAVGPDDCENQIACSVDGESVTHLITPQPLDGTPCDINKVCCQKQCQELPSTEPPKKRCRIR